MTPPIRTDIFRTWGMKIEVLGQRGRGKLRGVLNVGSMYTPLLDPGGGFASETAVRRFQN
jgi:hypothetical protein